MSKYRNSIHQVRLGLLLTVAVAVSVEVVRAEDRNIEDMRLIPEAPARVLNMMPPLPPMMGHEVVATLESQLTEAQLTEQIMAEDVIEYYRDCLKKTIKAIAEDDRVAVLTQAKLLITAKMNEYTRAKLIEVVAKVGADLSVEKRARERADVVSKTKSLIVDEMNGGGESYVIRAVAKVGEGLSAEARLAAYEQFVAFINSPDV